MKTRKRPAPSKPSQPAAAPPGPKAWHYVLAAVAALAVTMEVYRPALNGLFVYDDIYLPFYSADYGRQSLAAVVVQLRPLLMLSYWLNYRASGLEPFPYHLVGVLLHVACGVLCFVIVRKFVEWAGVGEWGKELLAAFAAGLFLLHPVQTESVAYVASRSETLSVFFFYAAWALFLYRRSQAVSWGVAAGVLVLFAAAGSTKEHTVVLPFLLLLTDYYWNPGFSLQGIRRNWKLYIPLALGGLAGVVLVFRMLRGAVSAGFGLKTVAWHEYLFTQGRAIWVYLRMMVLPVGQNVDHDFPFSRTILDHGALFGLIGLAALAAAAVYFRRRYPLASYGVLAALLLLAPTSSVVPIEDPLVERRLYLPMIPLLLVLVDFLRRWKAKPAAMASAMALVLAAAGYASYARNQVWSGPLALWQDSVAKSPAKFRPRFQLAQAYSEQGRCADAVREFEIASRLGPPDHRLLVDWALAFDCLNRPEEALAKLQQAASLRRTAHVYSQIGMIYAKMGRREEAFEALSTAAKLNPRYDMTYVYRGHLYALAGDFAQAAREYRTALQIAPENEQARNGLATAEQRLGAPK